MELSREQLMEENARLREEVDVLRTALRVIDSLLKGEGR